MTDRPDLEALAKRLEMWVPHPRRDLDVILAYVAEVERERDEARRELKQMKWEQSQRYGPTYD